jgi:hypothetical protein
MNGSTGKSIKNTFKQNSGQEIPILLPGLQIAIASTWKRLMLVIFSSVRRQHLGNPLLYLKVMARFTGHLKKHLR